MVPIVLIALYFGGARASDCGFRCRAVRGIGQFAAENVEVSEGVTLVRTAAENATGRTAPDSVLSAVKDFVGSYDLRVRLNRLLPREEVVAGLRKALTFLSGMKNAGDRETPG